MTNLVLFVKNSLVRILVINIKCQTNNMYQLQCYKNHIYTLNIKVLKVNSNSFLYRYDNFKNLNVMEHDNCMIYIVFRMVLISRTIQYIIFLNISCIWWS